MSFAMQDSDFKSADFDFVTPLPSRNNLFIDAGVVRKLTKEAVISPLKKATNLPWQDRSPSEGMVAGVIETTSKKRFSSIGGHHC